MATTLEKVKHLWDIVCMSFFVYDVLQAIGKKDVQKALENCGCAPTMKMIYEAEHCMYRKEKGKPYHQTLKGNSEATDVF